MRFLAKILLAFCATAVFFLGLETMQRIRHPEARDGYFEHPYYNSLGYRGREFTPEKAPGTKRILFYGGSTTFGVDCPAGETFPYLTGEIMQARLGTRAVETINVAERGKTSYWVVDRIEETLELSPDVLVIMTLYNDAVGVFSKFKDITERGDLLLPTWQERWFRLLKFLRRHSTLMVTLSEKISILVYGNPNHVYYRPHDPRAEQRLKKDAWFAHYPGYYRNNLERMVAIARAEGLHLVFLKPPLSHRRRQAHPLYAKAYDRLVPELQGVCAQHSIPLIDMSFLSEDQENFRQDNLHFTLKGKRLIAEAISRHLMESRRRYF